MRVSQQDIKALIELYHIPAADMHDLRWCKILVFDDEKIAQYPNEAVIALRECRDYFIEKNQDLWDFLNTPSMLLEQYRKVVQALDPWPSSSLKTLYTYRGADFGSHTLILHCHGIVLNKNSSSIAAYNLFKNKDKINAVKQLIDNDEDWAIMYTYEPTDMEKAPKSIAMAATASLCCALKYFEKTAWPPKDSQAVNHLLTLAKALGYINDVNSPLAIDNVYKQLFNLELKRNKKWHGFI